MILNDKDTYKELTASNQTKIEKQANLLVKGMIKNNFSKIESEKLLSSGSQPAQFKAFVKDHKTKSADGFPLRPIASVRGTATEKADWLVSGLLTSLVEWVPANLKNSATLIDLLKTTELSRVGSNAMFISLDVISLYPSIPIEFGLECVHELATSNWKNIDSKGITVEQMMNCLRFICYNYEIQFKDKVFKQIKGCPMGAHFAPPFAIITVHKIESIALSILRNNHGFSPQVYKRYIDDVLIGPIERDEDLTKLILETFNSVNKDIQFTLEVPKINEPLPFLDINIKVADSIEYSWYSKPCHSNNSLKRDSWVPSAIKSNFIKNTVFNVSEKCSNVELRKEALNKLNTRFMINGFNKKNVSRKLQSKKRKRAPSNKNASFLTLNFVSDGLNRKINEIIKKYDFDIQLINRPANSISQIMKTKKKKQKHINCDICDRLSDRYKCSDRFLVYKFTCETCGDFYIGQTNRIFSIRFKEHMRSIANRDHKSALSQHIKEVHDNSQGQVSFKIDILKQCSTPLETRLMEAQEIDRLRPPLNRKHERTW